MVYEKLVEEYHRLMSEEQNTLLIYKSRLGRAINALSNKEQEVMEIYKQYKCLLNNPKNLFVKYTIFKEVSFASFEEFKESLVKVKGKVEEVAQKISLPEDITVY